MMGKTHAASGFTVAAGLALALDATPPEALLLLAGIPGFALLPDIDHPGSLAGRSLGRLSGLPSRLLQHRRETHSLIGVAAVALTVYAAVWALPNWLAVGFLFFITAVAVLSGLRAFGFTRRRSVWLPAAALLGAAYVATHATYVLPVAIAVGMLVHIAGDMLTKGGCPLLWPFSKRRFSLPLFRTNSPVEVLFLWVFILAGFACLYAWGALLYAQSLTP